MSGRAGSTYVRSGLVALAVVVVLGVLLNFFLLAPRAPGALDGPVVAQGIERALQFNANGQEATPPTVVCPTREPRRAGLTFTCHLRRGGGSTPVVVRETNAAGSFTFKVEAPAAG